MHVNPTLLYYAILEKKLCNRNTEGRIAIKVMSQMRCRESLHRRLDGGLELGHRIGDCRELKKGSRWSFYGICNQLTGKGVMRLVRRIFRRISGHRDGSQLETDMPKPKEKTV